MNHILIGRQYELIQRLEVNHKNLLAAGVAAHDLSLTEKNIRKKLWLQSFNSLMSAKFETGQVDDGFELFRRMEDFGLQADTWSYSIVLKALADSTRDDAADDAHRIWQILTSSWRQSPASATSVKPTNQHYTSVLVAWSRSRHFYGKAAKRAIDVFEQLRQDCEFDFRNSCGMPTLTMSRIHYATLLTTLARSRYRSDELDSLTVELVKKLMLQGPLEARLYNIAINALSRAGTLEAASMAEDVLDEMDQHHKKTGIASLKPSAKEYTYCMQAWSRVTHADPINAYRMIEDLLFRLESLFLASVIWWLRVSLNS